MRRQLLLTVGWLVVMKFTRLQLPGVCGKVERLAVAQFHLFINFFFYTRAFGTSCLPELHLLWGHVNTQSGSVFTASNITSSGYTSIHTYTLIVLISPRSSATQSKLFSRILVPHRVSPSLIPAARCFHDARRRKCEAQCERLKRRAERSGVTYFTVDSRETSSRVDVSMATVYSKKHQRRQET